MGAIPLRLKPKDVALWRADFLKIQKNICPLCTKHIDPKEAALDHDHGTGLVRAALHRNCNSVEGRVLHWARRSGSDPATFLYNLLDYWKQDYKDNPVHPNHKSPSEKKVTVLRRRLRKAKRHSTKARIQQEIKDLQ